MCLWANTAKSRLFQLCEHAERILCLDRACCMVRTAVFDELGGFDENYATEYNDVDFCLKAKEAGYRNLYIPHCELYHYESMSRGHPHSTNESYKKHVKEVNQFRKKWKNYVENKSLL